MLQQMLADDKADMVREAVVKSLGIIMGYIDDPDKYSQVCSRKRKGKERGQRLSEVNPVRCLRALS